MSTKADTKKLDRIIQRMEKGPVTARVGYFEDSGSHPRSGLTAGDIARIQHEGSEHIPQRPWVTDGAEEARLPTERAMAAAYRKFQRGEVSLQQAIRLATRIQEIRITQVLDEAPAFYQENAESTIKNKGFDHPLLEEGWIRDKIDTKVYEGE